jgi:hypothetical protein
VQRGAHGRYAAAKKLLGYGLLLRREALENRSAVRITGAEPVLALCRVPA